MPTTSAKQPTSLGNRGLFHAYDLDTYYTCTFDDDAEINNLANAGIYFFSGADCIGITIYAVSYSGGLYQIDYETGEYTFIADTRPLNSLVYDISTFTWYCCGYDDSSTDSLFTIDITTGATTLIGHFGIPNVIISLMCDTAGNMYGYDVLFGGNSHLYDIDKGTGAATNGKDMGHNFCYAQEGKFDLNDGTLYLAAYDIGVWQSYLATCDVDTGAVTILNYFSPNDEIDALCLPNWCPLPHDVGVKKIQTPVSGTAGIISPEITVQNFGYYDEHFPTECMISKKVYINYLLEDFEGNFPPIGWTVETIFGGSWRRNDYWSTPDTNYLGTGYCADANMQKEQSAPMLTLLTTSPIDLSAVPSAILDVDSYQYCYFYDFFLIDVSVDGGTTWDNIYKISETYKYGEIKLIQKNLEDYCGYSDVRIRFGFWSMFNWEPTVWQIDNVKVRSYVWNLEYDDFAYTYLGAGMMTNLTFPAWTPADLGVSENVDLEYKCDAQTLLTGDQHSNNDLKEKMFTLHYGYFHDVAITGIPSPVSGLPQTQPVTVTVKNQGQNAEIVNVNVQIGKITNPEVILFEDFSGGSLPPGWGTSHPSNWYVQYSDYAGGVAPELVFNYYPSSVDTFRCYTGPIDTTGYGALKLSFKQFINDYNGDYTLEVQTSTNGVDWSTVYTQAGGPYGPTTTTVGLTGGSSTLQVAFVFVGDSYNINYWYIDDVEIASFSLATEYDQTVNVTISPGSTLNVTLADWTPADLPRATTIDYLIDASGSMNTTDEYPVDNELANIITLRYQHDVGVTQILEPPQPIKDDLIWDNGPYTAMALSSQLDTAYPFNSQVADDFQFDETMDVTEVSFDGMFWNGGAINPIDLNIIFYADDGSGNQPTGAGMDDPTSTALFVETHTAVNGTYNGDGSYHYDITLDTWFVAEENTKYWFVAQFVGNYPPQWGICVSASQQLHNCMQGFPAIGIPYWTDPTYGDVSFQLMGHIHYVPPPGTFEIKAIVRNLGVTYPESTIPVEARVTHVDNNTVIYDYLKIIPGPLAPGNTTIIQFPDVYLEYLTAWEGTYLVEVWTALPGDDHPENDLKSTFYYHWIHDVLPPITNHSLEGTMGQNDWYVSDVHVTITAYDPFPPLKLGPKPPSGVNHTYYKLHAGAPWIEYTQDFNIDTDGTYELYYYSIDKAGNAESVKGPFAFKIDRNAPTINLTAIPLNPLNTRWRLIINASDNMSGLAKIEVYIDDVLVGNISSPPWVFEYVGDGEIAQVIAYDNAGNSAMSNQVKNEGLSFVSQVMAQSIMVSVQQRNLLHS